LGSGTQDARARRRLRLGVRPVVELFTAAAPAQPVDVPLLGIDALQLLVGEVAVLLPLLFLGDAEVDEGPVPDVGESHIARNVTEGGGRRWSSRGGRRSLPPRPRPDSPGSFPSRARAGRAPRL